MWGTTGRWLGVGMKKSMLTLVFAIAAGGLVVILASAFNSYPQGDDFVSGVPTKIESVSEAFECANKPAANESGTKFQVALRLDDLSDRGYQFDETHFDQWHRILADETNSVYGRLVAAYFTLPDKTAADFLTKLLASENIRYQNNAACTITRHLGDDSKDIRWGEKELLLWLPSAAVSKPFEYESTNKEYPEGDRFDADGERAVDYAFSRIRSKESVPTAIAILEANPNLQSPAIALGEIGDPRGIPVLLDILKRNDASYHGQEIRSLAMLNCKEALPLLIARMPTNANGDKENGRQNFGWTSAHLWSALLELGDESIVTPLSQYIRRNDISDDNRAHATRVLVQLSAKDPVAELLTMLRNEEDMYLQSQLIRAIGSYGDGRALRDFQELAATSPESYVRHAAIFGLSDLGNRDALLALAALLEADFVHDTNSTKNSRSPQELREAIEIQLKQYTGEDFGSDRAGWETWIRANVNEG